MKEKSLVKIQKILIKEPKLIEMKGAQNVVFVGDTHGDLEASQRVIKDYLKPKNKIIFLGDYVDRGPFSKENLDFLLEKKLEFPDQIYLLQGNHEGHHILKFSPADFWEGLNEKEYQKYSSIVEKFPLVVVTKDIIALHGVLPDVKNLKEINQIKLGDERWMQIVWGDFVEEPGSYLGMNPFTGRPEFGRDWFFELMERLGERVLIRSHQPDAPQFMFNDRCLTIFTSPTYWEQRSEFLLSPVEKERTIAILDFKKEIKTAKDLEVIKI